MKLVPFLCIVCLISLSSCATLINTSRQNVTINSNPSGAKITVDGTERGVTPTVLPLKRRLKGNVTLSKDGYQSMNVPLQTTFNTVSILNTIGILGWLIDAATGAISKYEPATYTVELQPNK